MAQSDLAYLDACADAYVGVGVGWDIWVEPEGGVCWGLRHLADRDLVVLRGTKSLEDVYYDLLAAIPTRLDGYEQLGPLPRGFTSGLTAAYAGIIRQVRRPVALTGHSLGAAHAQILAGMLIMNGTPPINLVTFARPAPGAEVLADVTSVITSQVSYVNPLDEIPRLPPQPPWHQPGPVVRLAPNKVPRHAVDPFAAHHLEAYRLGLVGYLNPGGIDASS